MNKLFRNLMWPLLLAVMAIFMFADEGQAQQRCADINPSSLDTFSVAQVRGKPGDTIQLPIRLHNVSNAAALQAYVTWDTSLFRPVFDGFNIDPISGDTAELYRFSITSRWDPTKADPQMVEDVDSPAQDPNVARFKILGLPLQQPPELAIPIGTGTIMNIDVVISDTATQGQSADVRFYEVDLFTPDFSVFLGCQITSYSDLGGTGVVTVTKLGRITVDTAAAPLPTISSFTTSADTVNAGESVTLSWSASNADSLVLNSSVGGRINSYTSLNSSTSLSVSTTTTFTLTAYNNEGSTSRQVSVFVQGSSDNAVPVVAALQQSAFTINQGATVSFPVSASDADGDPITLFASNLPANASFGTGGEVSGVGSVTGNFSFTPNTSQEGTYTVEFRARDDKNATSSAVTATITVEGPEFDILFSKSRVAGSPVGGLAGKRSVLFPVDMVTSQDVYGVQFDMYWDNTLFDLDSIITTGRTPNWVVYDNVGQTWGEVRIVTFDMDNQPLQVDTTNTTTILYMAMTIDSSAEWGNYPIYLENGWESTNPDPGFPSLPLLTDSAVIQVDRFGDVTLDQRIDVADAVSTVGSILQNVTLTERQQDAGDVIVDQVIDVFDLVGIVNLIYDLPVDSQLNAPSGSELFATVNLSYPDLFVGSSDKMVVQSELPEDIAGVEMTISYDPTSIMLGKPMATVDASGLQLSYKNNGAGKMKILMNFTNPFNGQQLIHRGIADLVEIPMSAQRPVEFGNQSQLRLDEIKLSTPTARQVQVEGFGPPLPTEFELFQNYPNPFNPTTTIEFSIAGQAEHVTLEIFNVLGQQVDRLLDETRAAGHYSVEWDATSSGGQKVATGVYFYRLQVGGQSQTKKMLLLK